MTTQTAAQIDRLTRRRSIWKVIIRAAFVATVVSAGSWVLLTSVYEPLSSGITSGPRTRSLKPLTDGVQTTRYILVGPVGQPGRFMFDLSNKGRVPVRVDGAAISKSSWGISEVGWVPPPGNGELVGGYAKDVRPLPVTIKPGEWVILWVTVTKPRCGDITPGAIDSIPLRWSILGRQRFYDMPLRETNLEIEEIALCPPPGAFKHLE